MAKVSLGNKMVSKKVKSTKIDEVKLSDEEIVRQDEIKRLVSIDDEDYLSWVIGRLKLGIKLVEAKKDYGKSFYNVINGDVMPRKEVQRAMKLVLKEDVDFKTAMDTKGGIKDVENNCKLLEIDKRIEVLDKKSIENMNKPTLSKLNKLKLLGDTEFSAVISGEDKSYMELMKNRRTTMKEKKDKEHKSKKPKEMDETTFDNYFECGIYSVITIVNSLRIDNNDLEKKLLEANEKIANLNGQLGRDTLPTNNIDIKEVS